MNISKNIFSIQSEAEFQLLVMELFQRQYEANMIYHQFVRSLSIDPSQVTHIPDIPFLPVELFRTQKIITGDGKPQKTFLSSGTTSMERSRHIVTDLNLYHESLSTCFYLFYGHPSDYNILSLTPSPFDNPDSSLIHMIRNLIELSGSDLQNYFTNRKSELAWILRNLQEKNKKILLIGLTHELMDFAEAYPGPYPGVIFIETGGMKGRREELTRDELHERLCRSFGVEAIQSEYGMTELLSQAWSDGHGRFKTPPWMRILIRDPEDPLRILGHDETGGINIIDLANMNSCSFIATQDIGHVNSDGSFEVLGRFDFSDIRGCSLMSV